ncbi:MAG: Na/Pi cotransporter family protein [Bacillota bacterium]
MSYLGFIVGLAMFMFSLFLLRSSLDRLAGTHLRPLLQLATMTPLRATMVSTVVTALLHSSSLVTVITINLVNNGFLTLRQAIGVILGTNIGTTATAQVVSFPVEKAAWLLLVAGALLFFRRKRYEGMAFLATGLIFMSLMLMSGSAASWQNLPLVTNLLYSVSAKPLQAVLAGVIITALLQSSTVFAGMLIALASVGIINLPTAIALVLGSNIGSCVTALLASIGANRGARRVAYIHVALNIVGVMAIYPWIEPYARLIALSSASLPRQIANAHTLFNVVTSLAVLPFLYKLKWPFH